MNTLQNYRKTRDQLKRVNELIKNKAYINGFNFDLNIGGNRNKSEINYLSFGFSSGIEEEFYNLIRKGLESSLVFWEKELRKDLAEIQKELND